MNELVVADKAAEWLRLKALVLDSISSPITRRVYNLGLDEFISWYTQEPRPGFTKATVSAWRVALEARKVGPISIKLRLTAVRKLAVEAADNGLLAPALAGIARIKGVRAQGIRTGNWLTLRQAQALLSAPDIATTKGLRDRAILAVLLGCGLRRSEVAVLTFGHIQQRDGRWCIVGLVGKHHRVPNGAHADLGQGGNRCLGHQRQYRRRSRFPSGEPWRSGSRPVRDRADRLAVTPAVRCKPRVLL